MVNYTPSNQLKLSLFKHPFEQDLDKENRWVKLAELIPQDELLLSMQVSYILVKVVNQ